MRPVTRWALFGLVVWRLLAPVIAPVWPKGQRHPWRVEGRTVFVGDNEYLVRQTGPEGGPDVVLIHGLGGSSLTEWFAIGPILAERCRVTLVDLRNHGLSHSTTEPFGVEDLADDVSAVLGIVGVNRATVAGYSMGGTVAQSLAFRHPELVERLVLIATFANHHPSWRWGRRLAFLVLRAWERLTGLGSAEVRAGYLLAAGAVPMPNARWLWRETHRRDFEAGAVASFALMRFDSTPWLGRIRVPTLVVVPGRDQLVPARWQRELVDLIPGSEILELPEARHEAPMTHGHRIAEAILRFTGAGDGSRS